MVQRQQAIARQELGYSLDAELDRTAQAAVARLAFRRALADLGLLEFSSRRNHD
jgi:hypothetical protein